MRVFALLLLGLTLPALAQQKDDPAPEAATGFQHRTALTGQDYMISVANPHAAFIGKNILQRGGSAMDAAIAMQATLTLVEPQSSGIGGGAFILYWDNKTKKLHTFDGRETAPNAVNANLFLDAQGRPAPWQDAVQGGRAVGTPGVLRALELGHSKFGKLPWADLFFDAARLAELGFEVSPRLAKLLEQEIHPGLKTLAPARYYFYPFGKPLEQGTKLINEPLAKTLLAIGSQGADYFYKGPLAEHIVNAVQNSSINPGKLSAEDLATYRAKEREPVCTAYKVYRLCSMGPPSSGGLTVMQMLLMLEDKGMENLAPDSLEAVHLFTQASRLAFADRDMYMADSDFTRLPYGVLISPTYTHSRGERINSRKDMGPARPGMPYPGYLMGGDDAIERPNTSHMSIVDSEGNAVSMTTTIEAGFGSGLMVNGFLLNNQMTDFSTNPKQGDRWVLNRIEPGKRPRSSMSPFMVFDEKGKLILVIGSPGGSRIINYVAQALIGVLDWKLDVQQAINLPHYTNVNRYTELEAGTRLEALKPALEKMGHRVVIRDLNSGLHGIEVFSNKLVGGADPRREGAVVTRTE